MPSATLDHDQLLRAVMPAADREAFDSLAVESSGLPENYREYYSSLGSSSSDFQKLKPQIDIKSPQASCISKIEISYSNALELACIKISMQGNNVEGKTGPASLKVFFDVGKLDASALEALRNDINNKVNVDPGSKVGKGNSILQHELFQLDQLKGHIKYIEGAKVYLAGEELVGVRFGNLSEVVFAKNCNLDGATFQGEWKGVEISDCSLRYARMQIRCDKSTTSSNKNKIINSDAEGLNCGTSELADLSIKGTSVVDSDFGECEWQAKDLLKTNDPEKLAEAQKKYIGSILYTESGTRFFSDDGANSVAMTALQARSKVEDHPTRMTVAQFEANLHSGVITDLAGRLKADLPKLVERIDPSTAATNLGPASKISLPEGAEISRPILRLAPAPEAKERESSALIVKISEFKVLSRDALTASTGSLEFTVKEIGPAWGVTARFMQNDLDLEIIRMIQAMAEYTRSKEKTPPADAPGKTKRRADPG